MADQIPFGVVEHILTNLGSSTFQEIESMYGVPKELTKLKDNLDVIKGVLLDAEEQQQQKTRGIEAWVQRLKGAVYDADDLLDDYETHYLQRGGFARQVSDFFSSANQVAFRFNMSHRLKDINERLDAIEKKIPMLNLTRREAIHIGVENSWRETHSFSLPSEILGREENKEEIIRKLSSNNEEILSVVAIVGFGGLGKTTLTQLVYNDERVKHFEHKTWVCISDDSGDGLDVKLWVKKILKSMGVQDVESLTLDGLKDKLHDQISQKKYLLVLDDVWNENPGKWYEVKKLLTVGAKGSKIIVTTRKLNVTSIMEDKSPVSLKGLGENESWDLFSKFAFREQEILKPEIVEIGEEIAKMCKGVPLVIKSLAMILQSKREPGQWLSIRNNKNLLSLGDENENVLGVLKLSYDNLSTHLRQCFTYCALFPKDYAIEKKLLVQLWNAQGYIQSTNDNNEQLEDIGDQYLEELLSRSLLEKAGTNHFKMHDLIHDLAQSIVGSEILVLRSDVNNIPEEVRHVSLFEEVSPMIKALKGKPIRTFLNLGEHSFEDSTIVNSFFPSFMCLHALNLSRMGVEKVPKCLGKLSHLRYLDLSYNDFQVLPNAITRLKNLQTLKLKRCWNLQRFPKKLGELINLRHLENDSCYKLAHMPHGIGKLTLLQSLPSFVVGNDIGWSRNQKIGGLSELKGLNQLREGLFISNLQNVRDVELVSRGEILKGKQYLQSLRLKWKRWVQDEGYEGEKSVMEGLQPHQHLKDIIIEGYGGTEFPSWMMNDGLGSLLPYLIKIEIRRCSRCKILPPFSQLPSLKSLKLEVMKEVVELNEGSSATTLFPSLESLKLFNMPKLKELWRMDLLAEEGPSFSHLSKLYIYECSGLASLHPSPSLSQLEIGNCHNLASLELHSSPFLSQLEISYCHRLASLELHSSPSLSQLEIRECPNLQSLELHSSPSLSRLTIHDCPNLTSLELPSSPSLSQLDIIYCPNLTSMELPSSPSLSLLTIHDCPNLTSMELPSSLCLSQLDIRKCHILPSLKLHSSPSLSLLTIHDCPNLTSMELPSSPSLSLLTIHDCPNLTSMELPSSLCLSQLEIIDCHNLASLELHSSPSLSQLEIRNCHNLASLELPSSHCLSKLKIIKCPNLASSNVVVASLPRLEELSLRGVRAEVLRQFMFISASSSLKSLSIWEIDGMISLPEEPLQYVSTLETLHIVKCSGLATLLHWMGSLSSLTELIIYDCSELTSLPEEIYSLKKLQTFYFCDYPHLEERYNKETGKDRAKIDHIPRINFQSDRFMKYKVRNP
ncbi:putative disease resistance protein RGA4 [Vitis riparia]|uniref:putative disease resistance protein RGA4 n=1 Tax=Vitis riparia TaxID=96939 RepID=UPI00155B1E3B|nr:putative disease resistance protein RGA4 [Vitis riparia]